MTNPEIEVGIYEIIASVGKKCVAELNYTRLTSPEVNLRIDEFHRLVGNFPTFEQVKLFNDQNAGVNCALYAEAACDLLRSNGITADKFNLLDPSTSKGAADNHAVVHAAGIYWLEPQTSQIFRADNWELFAKEYAALLKVDPTKLVAYCPRSHDSWFGSNWRWLE